MAKKTPQHPWGGALLLQWSCKTKADSPGLCLCPGAARWAQSVDLTKPRAGIPWNCQEVPCVLPHCDFCFCSDSAWVLLGLRASAQTEVGCPGMAHFVSSFGEEKQRKDVMMMCHCQAGGGKSGSSGTGQTARVHEKNNNRFPISVAFSIWWEWVEGNCSALGWPSAPPGSALAWASSVQIYPLGPWSDACPPSQAFARNLAPRLQGTFPLTQPYFPCIRAWMELLETVSNPNSFAL